jgi:uncharacterized protein (TIGR03067 family)
MAHADEMIEGTWIPISAELGGRPFPETVLQTMKLVLTDNSYTATVGNVTDVGTVTFHSTRQPKDIDIVGTDGPNKGRTLLAIHELIGDTLRICYDLEGKTRPSEFKTYPSTRQFLVSYVRTSS